ncbi:MAG: hypothetical protein V1708_01650 [Candidatus Micrarchaeota archaeon]
MLAELPFIAENTRLRNANRDTRKTLHNDNRQTTKPTKINKRQPQTHENHAPAPYQDAKPCSQRSILKTLTQLIKL